MAKPPAADTVASPETGAELWGTASTSAPTLDPPEVREGRPAAEPPPADRYEILGEIARGGIGRVMAANDRELGRAVALKELLRDTPGNRERFRREILFTARLQHPSIVPLYEAVHGPDGRERYAMKLVTGRTLEAAVAAAASLDDRLALLPHLLAVADAVAYAHARGVVHRDIKPANILLGSFGETVLIDWGVAKDLAAGAADVDEDTPDAAELTRIGAIIGTPAYMAPEQARGEAADPRADVYALGATLYHVLSGGPPFTGDARTTIESLRSGQPPPALELRAAGAPPDLLAIARRAMAPQREDRYPSGQELRQDLQRFATGQLVAARTYSTADLVRRWLARHALLLSVVTVALLLLAVTGTISAARVVEERDAATEARGLAEARSNALTLSQARSALTRDPTEAAAWLATYPEGAADWGRAFELAMEADSRGPARLSIRPLGENCDAVTMSRDGRTVIPWGSGAGAVDMDTGAQLDGNSLGRVEWMVSITPEDVIAVDYGGTVGRVDRSGKTTVLGKTGARPTALAADARFALVGDMDGTLATVELASGAPPQTQTLGARVTGVGVRGGEWVAATTAGDLWSGRVGTPTARRLATNRAGVQAFVLAPDGSAIIGDTDGVVAQVSASGHLTPLFRLPGAVAVVAVSADGGLVAAADGQSAVLLLDRATGSVSSPPWTPSRAFGLVFSPVAPVLAASLQDGTLRLWRPATGVVEALVHPGKLASAPDFSPNGDRIAVCGIDGMLRVWPVPSTAGQVFLGHVERVFHPVFLPDGRVATDGDDHTVRVWTPGDPTPLTFEGHTDRVYGITASPDGRRIISAGVDGLGFIWDLATRKGIALRGHQGRVQAATWLPDGVTAVTAGRDGTVRTWDAEGRPLRSVQAHEGAAWWATPSTDGDSVWSVGADRALRRWHLADGRLETVLDHLGEAGGPTLRTHPLPDGRILTCDGGTGLLLVGPDGGAPQRIPLADPPACTSLRVAPDGRHVALPADTRVSILDLEDGSVRPLIHGKEEIHGVEWSPDGRLLATAGLDGTARVWRVADGAGYIARRAESAVLGVAFSADSGTLAVVGVDPAVWVGPVDETRLLEPDPAALHARLAAMTTARFEAE